jgi:hypothetical protein
MWDTLREVRSAADYQKKASKSKVIKFKVPSCKVEDAKRHAASIWGISLGNGSK